MSNVTDTLREKADEYESKANLLDEAAANEDVIGNQMRSLGKAEGLQTAANDLRELAERVEREVGPAPGEDHPTSKLTEAEVREIRKADDDVANSELAEEYGVSDGAIWKIRNGETWTHIDNE